MKIVHAPGENRAPSADGRTRAHRGAALPPVLAEVAEHLHGQFPAVPLPRVEVCVRAAAHALRGSVIPTALPEMLTRLARVRLLTVLLDGDGQTAADLASATSQDAVARIAVDAACERLGCPAAGVAVRDGASCRDTDRRLPLSECLSGWTMLHGSPACIDDSATDPRVPAQARPDAPRSLLVVPVPGPERPVAALAAYWSTTGRASRADAGWLARLAAAIGAALGALTPLDAGTAPQR